MASLLSIFFIGLIVNLVIVSFSDGAVNLPKELSEIKALQDYDKQLATLRELSTGSLADNVGFALLYHMREDRWKQSGDWEALEYTIKAFKILDSDDYAQNHTYIDLRNALVIHKIRLLTILGRYKLAEELVVKELSHNIASSFHSNMSSAAEQQRGLLYYAYGDSLLSSGDAASAVKWFSKAIQQLPCLHLAYYKKATALAASPHNNPRRNPTSSNTTATIDEERESLGERTDTMDGGGSLVQQMSAFMEVLEDMLQRLYPDAGKVWLLSNVPHTTDSTMNDRICAFVDELEYLNTLLRYSQVSEENPTDVSDDGHRTSPLSSATHFHAQIKLTPAIDKTGVDEAENLSLMQRDYMNVVRATYFWSLYLLTEALEDYHLAFFYLQQARVLERFRVHDPRHATYSLDESEQQVQHILKTFTKDYYPSISTPSSATPSYHFYGSESARPIFIVGFFRSGSTLLETLLSAHPRVWGLGENSAFATQMHYLQEEMLELANYLEKQEAAMGSEGTQAVAEELFRTTLQKYAVKIDAQMKRRCLQYVLGNATVPMASTPAFHSKKAASKSTTRTNAEGQERQSSNANDKSRPNSQPHDTQCTHTIDKMLLNYRNMGLIHLLFPRARILHTMRDPLDTLWSCMTHRFGDTSAYTLDVHLLVREFALYLQVVQHFRETMPPVLPRSSKGRARRNIGACHSYRNETSLVAETNHTPYLCYQSEQQRQQFRQEKEGSIRSDEHSRNGKGKKNNHHERRTLPNGHHDHDVWRLPALVDVRYDAVVTHPQHLVREIWTLLGLEDPSDDGGRSSHSNSSSASRKQDKAGQEIEGPVRTASYLQVRRPVGLSNQGKWRRYYEAGLRHTLVPLLRDAIYRTELYDTSYESSALGDAMADQETPMALRELEISRMLPFFPSSTSPTATTETCADTTTANPDASTTSSSSALSSPSPLSLLAHHVPMNWQLLAEFDYRQHLDVLARQIARLYTFFIPDA